MLGCSSEGYDTNGATGLGVNDGYGRPVKQTERHESLFVIAESIVFVGGRQAGKNPGCIGEVEAVLFQIGCTLLLIPLELHRRSVYTACLICK